VNPYAPPRQAEGQGSEPGPREAASILRRLAARAVDLTLGFVVAAPLALLLSIGVELPLDHVVARVVLGGLVMSPIVSVVLIGLRWDTYTPSLGKTLFDLQVVDAESGEPVSFVRGMLARESVLLVLMSAGCCAPPLFILLIGVMSWTGRRAPHDWMTDAVVVRHGGR
jgi:uncharacterized RDD family membrane protein YckC